jgi:hypothetical protein
MFYIILILSIYTYDHASLGGWRRRCRIGASLGYTDMNLITLAFDMCLNILLMTVADVSA